MNKNEKVKIIAEVAIMTAIAFALDFLQGGLTRGLFPNGGSIGLAMVPILVLAYRRGFVPALVSGFILAIIQMTGGVYAIASEWYSVILQILLDYVLAYPLVACAGLFYQKFRESEAKSDRIKWIIIGSVLGGFLKYVSHVLSGVLFWKNADFAGGPFLYSVLYNGTYMIPNIIIATLLLVLLLNSAPHIFLLVNYHGKSNNQNEEVKNNE